MLLGSPPDMVRGHSLRKTDPAAVCGGRITKDIIRYGFRKGNKNFLKKVKKGVRVLNFSRGALVDTDAMLAALADGTVAAYATDFPDDALLGVENVIAIPHLGASTPESEDNCAVMAAEELKDYIENGNIRNAVNFPNISMARGADTRICLAHRNIPNTIGSFTQVCGEAGINIENMLSKSRGDWAYTILDVTGDVTEDVREKLAALSPVVRARVIK